MSYINESKSLTLNVNFKGQIIKGTHTISYYDSPSIDVAELEYDLDEYKPKLNEEDAEELSEIISEYIYDKCSRGLNDIVDNEVIDLNVRNGVLIEMGTLK